MSSRISFLPQRSLFHRLLGTPVLFSAAVAVIVLFCVPRNMADPDIWWHLRNAQTLISTHHFITRDAYSYTAFGAPWMNHEWIAELPFYIGWEAAAGKGVYLVTVATIDLIILGVFLLAYRRSGDLRAALLASVIAIVLATVSFGPRTLLFGWLCLLLELWILDRSEQYPDLLWAMPCLFAIWINTHGSWLIGMAFFVISIAMHFPRFRCGLLYSDGLSRARLSNLLAAISLSIAALFLNPYGWRLVAYPFNLAFHQKLNIGNVEEWRSLDFHSPRGLIALTCLALLAIAQLCRARPWKLADLAYLFIAVFAAFRYSRFLFLFGIVVAPLIATSISSFMPKGKAQTRSLINAAVLFVLFCFVVGRVRSVDVAADNAMHSYPVEALPYLAALHPAGPLFNEYLWGGFMIWNLRQLPVFIDSRVDIFEYNGTFKDYLDIIRIKDSLELLNKHGVRYVLYEKDTPLIYLLEHTPGWKTDYDQRNIILMERVTSNQESRPGR